MTAASGRTITIFPHFQGNPYLTIMHLATSARGFTVRSMRDLADFATFIRSAGSNDVLHLNWTHTICQSAPSLEEAQARLEAFTTDFAAMRARGVKVVWTVHNRLPHEVRYVDVERQLCGFVANNCDAIHIMSAATPDLVADLYELDRARTVLIPHPSYQGLYATSEAERAEARASFSIEPGRRAVLFFGQMRLYKGLDTLIHAMNSLVEAGPPTQVPVLLLAGGARPEMVDRITDLLDDRLDVIREHNKVPDDQLSRWFAAADLAVYPYTDILNSGSVHLAATLEVPAVLPGLTHLREQFADEDWVRFYDPNDPVASLTALLANDDVFRPAAQSAAAFSERFSPWRIARQMADVIESV